MSLSASIAWTRLARDRWEAPGLDSRSSNQSARRMRVASGSRAPKAKALVSQWNCRWRTAIPKARNERQHSKRRNMNRLKMSFGLLALLLLVFVSCSKSGADNDGDEDGSHPAENMVVPETPAPVQPAGK